MKKCLVIILILLILTVMLVGCNKQIIDLKLKYDRAYCKIGDEWLDFPIKKWNDYDGEQLQLILEDDTVLLVSSYYCILYQGALPKGELR